jgi:hypothetical protein
LVAPRTSLRTSPRDNGLVDLSADGDQINLHPIDADERPSAPGKQDFSRDLIPEGEAFTAPGQISWLHQGGETWITLNTDADLAADATISISGSHMPDASWFIF